MRKVEPATPAAKKAYDGIGEDLAAMGVERSAMFGMPALKHSGKAFAGLFGDAMVFKLDGDAHAGALRLRGAELFDPSGMGRPMKAWVVVPRAHLKAWPTLAEAAAQACAAATKPAKRPSRPTRR
jgi:hypothetical protein